jgi:hypothetical protein
MAILAVGCDSDSNSTDSSSGSIPIPVAGSLELSSANYTVSEAGGSQTVSVNRTQGSTGTVSVDYSTSDDTAVAAQDYVAAAGTLMFVDGETSQTFSVTINEDTIVESDEKFNLNLSNPTNGATLAGNAHAEIIIIDDDSGTAQSTYDFEALTVNNAIDGQDNWEDPLGLGGAVAEADSTSVNGTLVAGAPLTTAVNPIADITRVNDAAFSLPSLSGTENTAVLQFDLTGEGTALFTLGHDLNGDGLLTEGAGEIGPVFGAVGRHFHLREANLGADTEADFASGDAGSDWYQMQLRIDFTANAGAGAGSVFVKNLTDGDPQFRTIPELQDINLQLNRMDAAAQPSSWDAMWVRLVTAGGQRPSADNLEVRRVDGEFASDSF